MKLTRRKLGKTENQAVFYRTSEKGMLRWENDENPRTEETIAQMDFKRSWKGRLFQNIDKEQRKEKEGEHPFEAFASWLVGEIDGEPLKLLPKADEYKGKQLSDLLTPFGLNFKVSAKTQTLSMLIPLGQLNSTNKQAKKELVEIKEKIKEEIEEQKNRLEASIDKNKVLFEVSNGTIVPTSDKLNWLYSFLDTEKLAADTMLETYWNVYELDLLIEAINAALAEGDDGRIICLKVQKEFVMHHKKFRGKVLEKYTYNKETIDNKKVIDNEDKALLQFADVVAAYFKKTFPSKSKKTSKSRETAMKDELGKYYTDKKNQQGDKTAKLGYYKEQVIKKEVRRMIINQLTQALIQQGKLAYYYQKDNKKWRKEAFCSDHLSAIQIEEAFKKQLMNSLSWAISRLNYLFNYNGSTDILEEYDGKKEKEKYVERFIKALKNGEEFQGTNCDELKDKLICSFPIDKGDESKDDVLTIVYETLDCIANIRHKHFHYNNGSFLALVERVSEELVSESYQRMTLLLEKDIKEVQTAFQEQIRSYGIAEFYEADELRAELKKAQFILYTETPPFMPSFRKMLKKGIDFVKAGDDERSKFSWYSTAEKLEKENRKQQIDKETHTKWMAYKNLLQILYYHAFLPKMENDSEYITNYINVVIDWNKDRAAKKKQAHFRYEDMPRYQGEDIAEYLKTLQKRQAIQQSNRKDSGQEPKNHYVSFMQDVAMHAFHAFLAENFNGDLLCNPIRNEKTAKKAEKELFGCDEEAEQEKEPLIKMQCRLAGNSEFIPPALKIFYPFLRLLDPSELNKLHHQFIRYRHSLESRKAEQAQIGLLKQFEELMALVAFTIPQTVSDKLIESCFSSFIEGNMTEYRDLFYQNDKETIVKHKHMMLLARSGSMNLYQKIYKDTYKITKKEHEKYCRLSLLGAQRREGDSKIEISSIEQTQTKLIELHEKLAKVQPSDKQRFRKHKKELEEYEKLLKKKQEYNHLSQKLTFESLYEIHRIHIELLGRFVAFAEDWERDMRFLMIGLVQESKMNPKHPQVIFGGGNIVSKIGKNCNAGERKLLTALCWHDTQDEILYERMKIRNTIAHLNHITQPKNQPSIEEMIDDLRVLLAYDRKRQNAVTKAVKEILETEHHIELHWKRENGLLSMQASKGKPVQHLKNFEDKKKPKFEELHSKEMLQWVDCLLKFRYNEVEEKGCANPK